MQDDYNRFIRHSMRQAQCDYEDIFEADVMEAQYEASPCLCAEMPAKEASRKEDSCMQASRKQAPRKQAAGKQASCGGCGGMKDAQTESRDAEDCGCDKKCRPEATLPVMVFIEPQTFGRTYNEAEALRRGTLFPVLDKPFMGGGCHC